MLSHRIVVLGYKQESVLHTAAVLLTARTGVVEKLHLKDKHPFVQDHTHLFYQLPGSSNWFQIILSLPFWLHFLFVILLFIFLLLTVCRYYIFLLLYPHRITHLLCGNQSPLLMLDFRSHACPLPTSDELGFTVYCGTAETWANHVWKQSSGSKLISTMQRMLCRYSIIRSG